MSFLSKGSTFVLKNIYLSTFWIKECIAYCNILKLRIEKVE